jgi:hypothetical protein
MLFSVAVRPQLQLPQLQLRFWVVLRFTFHVAPITMVRIRRFPSHPRAFVAYPPIAPPPTITTILYSAPSHPPHRRNKPSTEAANCVPIIHFAATCPPSHLLLFYYSPPHILSYNRGMLLAFPIMNKLLFPEEDERRFTSLKCERYSTIPLWENKSLILQTI